MKLVVEAYGNLDWAWIWYGKLPYDVLNFLREPRSLYLVDFVTFYFLSICSEIEIVDELLIFCPGEI
jgi:hypothetical protein